MATSKSLTSLLNNLKGGFTRRRRHSRRGGSGRLPFTRRGGSKLAMPTHTMRKGGMGLRRGGMGLRRGGSGDSRR